MRGDLPEAVRQQAQDCLALAALWQGWLVQTGPGGSLALTPPGKAACVTCCPANETGLADAVGEMARYGFALESPPPPPETEKLPELALAAVREGWAVQRGEGPDSDLWSFTRAAADPVRCRVACEADLEHLRAMLSDAGLMAGGAAGRSPAAARITREGPGGPGAVRWDLRPGGTSISRRAMPR